MLQSMKVCSTCKRELPETEFNKKGSGLQPACRVCSNAASKKYYQVNKQEHLRKVRIRTLKQIETNVAYVSDLKESTPCTDCKQKYPYYVMEFDHLGDKRDNISRMARHGLSLDTIKSEIAKCEIVCANCHRFRTHLRGYS